MVGIERIRFYVPTYSIDMRTLAEARGVDPAKYSIGIGQDVMAICPADEDVVSLAAGAAESCIAGIDRNSIDTVIFATESGVDHSKAAGIYVHSLLELPAACQVYEVKQACCSSSLALHAALDRVARRPGKRVLVIAADIARYGLLSAGEPTQGAGAVALLVSAAPKVIEIFPETGYYTEDVMDFWRPTYMEEALVDGKFSIRMYLKALEASWKAYVSDGGRNIDEFARFCYHQPFTTMAHKAHRRLHAVAGATVGDTNDLSPSLRYNRMIGNTYSASLFISLCSLLEQTTSDLTGERVGLFGYGSGCVGAFYAGRILAGYREHLAAANHERMLDARISLSVAAYEAMFEERLPTDGSTMMFETSGGGSFCLKGIREHKRIYGRRVVAAEQTLGGVA